MAKQAKFQPMWMRGVGQPLPTGGRVIGGFGCGRNLESEARSGQEVKIRTRTETENQKQNITTARQGRNQKQEAPVIS